MQEGEDIALVESRPIEYRNTRVTTAEEVKELRALSLAKLHSASGLSRHTIIKARNAERIHKETREKLIEAVRILRGEQSK
jgi:hypothetical protein